MISLIIGLVVLGVALWAIEALIPMDAVVKRIIQVVIVLVVLIWLLRFAGMV
jgi:hypothetical protein